jgi:serine phosphatase RsbU (regulator of sigma subunit)
VLTLCTDGLTEARGGTEFLESHGVRAAIEPFVMRTAAAVAAAAMQRAREFSHGRLHDDAAIVVIRRSGPPVTPRRRARRAIGC